MRVVSGYPDHVVSLVMAVLRDTVGDTNILKTSPFDPGIRGNPAKEYLEGKECEHDSLPLKPEEALECLYTTQGCYYRLGERAFLESLTRETTATSKICKLAVGGLAATDPRYAHKILYVVENPRRITREHGSWPSPNTPIGFSRANTLAAEWLVENGEIPVTVVEYGELLERKGEALAKIKEFAGVAMLENLGRLDGVTPSKLAEVPDSGEWRDATYIWDMIRTGNFRGVVEYMSKPRSTHVVDLTIPCARLGSITGYRECADFCMAPDVEWVKKQIAWANENGIEWWNEPCLFECGLNPFADKDTWLSIEDSIDSNHWEVLNGGHT